MEYRIKKRRNLDGDIVYQPQRKTFLGWLPYLGNYSPIGITEVFYTEQRARAFIRMLKMKRRNINEIINID